MILKIKKFYMLLNKLERLKNIKKKCKQSNQKNKKIFHVKFEVVLYYILFVLKL